MTKTRLPYDKPDRRSCRASNYIHLLRKALNKAGYGHIPVISLNFSGTEKSSGFHLSLKVIQQLTYGVLLGDLIMALYNQSIPYEVNKEGCDSQVDEIVAKISDHFRGRTVIRYSEIRAIAEDIVKRFSAIERQGAAEKESGHSRRYM